MSDSNRKKLLKGHEGLRLIAYKDTRGFTTLGYGRNVESRGMPERETTQEQADAWLDEDLAYVQTQLRKRLSFYDRLSDVRQSVLVDMGFMGVENLMGFQHFLHYMSIGNWLGAKIEMLNSDWAHEVKSRAKDLANMVTSNQWPGFIA